METSPAPFPWTIPPWPGGPQVHRQGRLPPSCDIDIFELFTMVVLLLGFVKMIINGNSK